MLDADAGSPLLATPTDFKRGMRQLAAGVNVITVANGALEAKRSRQPPLTLVPLQKDVFYVAGEPSRRFTFIRTNDRVVALEVRRSRGDGQHFNRETR